MENNEDSQSNHQVAKYIMNSEHDDMYTYGRLGLLKPCMIVRKSVAWPGKYFYRGKVYSLK